MQMIKHSKLDNELVIMPANGMKPPRSVKRLRCICIYSYIFKLDTYIYVFSLNIPLLKWQFGGGEGEHLNEEYLQQQLLPYKCWCQSIWMPSSINADRGDLLISSSCRSYTTGYSASANFPLSGWMAFIAQVDHTPGYWPTILVFHSLEQTVTNNVRGRWFLADDHMKIIVVITIITKYISL